MTALLARCSGSLAEVLPWLGLAAQRLADRSAQAIKKEYKFKEQLECNLKTGLALEVSACVAV
jgi:hypothetical protein